MGPSPITVPTNDHERGLIQRAQQGDSEACNELLTAYDRDIRGSIRPRAREQDVDDILQEARIRIWKKIRLYETERAPLVTFLKKYAIWSTLDFYRKRQQRRQVEMLVGEICEHYPDWENDEEMLEIMGACSPPNQGDDPNREKVHEHEAVLNKLLELWLSIDRPPHERIAFGYCKMLDWKPGDLAAKSSDELLAQLTADLEADFTGQSKLDEAFIHSAFESLRSQMPQTLRAVITNRDTQLRYLKLLDRHVGDTMLRDYYAGSPAADISHWWFGVRRRVLHKAVTERGLADSIARFL
jgi:RNA polymerase sigma factor (sigma-70 family)